MTSFVFITHLCAFYFFRGQITSEESKIVFAQHGVTQKRTKRYYMTDMFKKKKSIQKNTL